MKVLFILHLFSQPLVPWCDIYKKISKNGRQVAKISGNGLCLVKVVCKALNKDLVIKNSKNAQAKKI